MKETINIRVDRHVYDMVDTIKPQLRNITGKKKPTFSEVVAAGVLALRNQHPGLSLESITDHPDEPVAA